MVVTCLDSDYPLIRFATGPSSSMNSGTISSLKTWVRSRWLKQRPSGRLVIDRAKVAAENEAKLGVVRRLLERHRGDRVLIIARGRIVAEGSPQALINEYASREVLELRFPIGDAETHAADVDGIGERTETLPDRILIYVHDGDEALAEVHRRGLEPVGSLVRRASLEDVFVRLTTRENELVPAPAEEVHDA